MRILLNFSLLLLMLVALLAALGAVLVEKNKLKLKTGPRYAQLVATVMTGVAYWMVQNSKVLAGISGLNLIALLGFLWVVIYYMVWGVLAYQLNRHHHRYTEGESMLTMLYNDSHPHNESQPQDLTGSAAPHPHDKH
jgi:hypothetical protein